MFLDEAERKYLFECDSQEQCVEWIDAVVKARCVCVAGVSHHAVRLLFNNSDALLSQL